MKITKTTQYNREFKRKLVKKHKNEEIDKVEKIESLLITVKTLKELMLNPLSRVYNINKKSGNLKEVYTADINPKIRMHIKPIGEYPYNNEEIVEVELVNIDDKHYGDG